MALCLKIMTPSEKSLSLSAAMENLLDHDDDFVNDDDASPSAVSSSRNKPAAPAGSTPVLRGRQRRDLQGVAIEIVQKSKIVVS